ncbi:hypothetical protein [Dyella silvatica]|uniref:hypothetical protein n=1 Tax=Dyella silvatica TaxID=2992128 RepID=UPI002254593E|nr:hypothetical protein [Dyella silvatica]
MPAIAVVGRRGLDGHYGMGITHAGGLRLRHVVGPAKAIGKAQTAKYQFAHQDESKQHP